MIKSVKNTATFSTALTFEDVLLAPCYSEVLPRDTDFSTRFSRNIKLNSPLISAAMDTVTEHKMAIAMAKAGGIGVIHKNMDQDFQAKEVALVKNEGLQVAAALGVGDLSRARALVNAGANALVLDSAHGHSKGVIDTLRDLKREFAGIDIVAGNVATAQGAMDLAKAGADAIKVGIGPGSICTTRIVSGVGVPQLSAIINCAKALEELDIPLIADGGIRFSGDIAKALAAGACSVMLGSIIAGSDESPGELFIAQGRSYKGYRGMGSLGAMARGSTDRYFQQGVAADKLVPEGIEGRVPYLGSAESVIEQLLGGLRSAMGYLGAANLSDLRQNASFVQITSAGLRESHVHDVGITKEAPNYRID